MELLPIGRGLATSAEFTVAPHTRGYLLLVDADGISIPAGAEARVLIKGIAPDIYYPFETLSSGRDIEKESLPPGTYVVRRTGNAEFGVVLNTATDTLAATMAPDTPAVSARAALHGWNGGSYERLSSSGGRLNVNIDSERFASASIISTSATDSFVAFPSTAADYLELSNTTTKVIEYRRNGAGAVASLPVGATRRIVLPTGNANIIEVRNATDAAAIDVTADAVAWLN